MIVDLDIRLWARPEDLGSEVSDAIRRTAATRWLQPEANLHAFAGAMQTVDAALVVGFESGLLRGSVNESLLHEARASADGRVFLARAIDPLAGGASGRVETARKDGFCAVWLDPALQGFNPTDTRAMRVFDRAEAHQLPVFLGWSGPQPASARLEFARPYLLDEVARTFPRLQLVIAGFGAPFHSETIALLAKHDRVFTTIAGVAARPWELLGALQACRDHGVDSRVLFGSGFPFDAPARAIESIYGVNGMIATTPLPHIARSVLREIVERDSISLLGLGAPPASLERATTRMLATPTPLEANGDEA